MRLINNNLRKIQLLVLLAVVGVGMIAPASAEFCPEKGVFLQRDPNKTGAVIGYDEAFNASTRSVTASLLPGGQYGDGMNLFAYLTSNPFAATDPSGLALTLDIEANHIHPTYLGGAHDGPLIDTVKHDHYAFHRALEALGWGPTRKGNPQQLADEFCGTRKLSTVRGNYGPRTMMDADKRRDVLVGALGEAGFTDSREINKLLREAERMKDGKYKPTKGRRGWRRKWADRRIPRWTEFERAHSWRRNGRTKHYEIWKPAGVKAKARAVSGAGVVGATLFLWNIDQNTANADYIRLQHLNATIDPRKGPDLFQEVTAFALIGDINSALYGTVYSWYLGYDIWRKSQDIY